MRAHGVTSFPDPSANGGIQVNGVDPRTPVFEAAQAACQRYLPNKGQPPVTSAADRSKAVAFAKCMRLHGEPDFPDPLLTAPHGVTRILVLRGMSFALGDGIDPRSPAFQRAAEACGVHLPGFGKAR